MKHFGRGDIPAIIEFLSDNVQWEQWADNSAQKAGVPWMQARKGKDGALNFLELRVSLISKISGYYLLWVMAIR